MKTNYSLSIVENSMTRFITMSFLLTSLSAVLFADQKSDWDNPQMIAQNKRSSVLVFFPSSAGHL